MAVSRPYQSCHALQDKQRKKLSTKCFHSVHTECTHWTESSPRYRHGLFPLPDRVPAHSQSSGDNLVDTRLLPDRVRKAQTAEKAPPRRSLGVLQPADVPSTERITHKSKWLPSCESSAAVPTGILLYSRGRASPMQAAACLRTRTTRQVHSQPAGGPRPCTSGRKELVEPEGKRAHSVHERPCCKAPVVSAKAVGSGVLFLDLPAARGGRLGTAIAGAEEAGARGRVEHAGPSRAEGCGSSWTP